MWRAVSRQLRVVGRAVECTAVSRQPSGLSFHLGPSQQQQRQQRLYSTEKKVKKVKKIKLQTLGHDIGEPERKAVSEMTPNEVVEQLDRFVIGQAGAKKAVAVALRNRWRRQRLEPEMREEVKPKNILMMGSTGCGKTEIARRLAKLTDSPFVKVEATKYTEVGFHGSDVDQIIKDLLSVSLHMQKKKMATALGPQTDQIVEELLVDCLLGKAGEASSVTRDDLTVHLRAGKLETQRIDIELPVKEPEMPSGQPGSVMTVVRTFNSLGLGGARTETRSVTVAEARALLIESESEKALKEEDIAAEAIKVVENEGIVFIDEIDKIVSSPSDVKSSADASAEGVQRDLLPLVEGSIINTKHGNVNTEHILFIASGAFQSSSPSDMMAELQGRLPIRVQLDTLTEEQLFQILTETHNNLLQQQIALLATEGVSLTIPESAAREIAQVSAHMNKFAENMGARRLHTVVERVMEQISYDTSSMSSGEHIEVTAEYVRERMSDLQSKTDLQRFML